MGSEKSSDKVRFDGLPWSLGGYHPSFPRCSNLSPGHRRFMAENLAYAVMRMAPFFFYSNVPVLLISVCSYACEAITIAWEQLSHEAPASSMQPQTGMAVFSTLITLCAYFNPGNTITDPATAMQLSFMQLCVFLNWCLWTATVVKQNSTPKTGIAKAA